MKLNLLSYKGRQRRRDYFFLSLAFSILFTPIAIYAEAVPASLGGIPIYLIATALAILYVFQIIKRLHDIGLPGLYWLMILIPVLNIGFDLWLLLKPGMEGPNKYGEDPKE